MFGESHYIECIGTDPIFFNTLQHMHTFAIKIDDDDGGDDDDDGGDDDDDDDEVVVAGRHIVQTLA